MTAPTPPAIATSEANPEEVIKRLEERAGNLRFFHGRPAGFYGEGDANLDRQAIDLIRSLEAAIGVLDRRLAESGETSLRFATAAAKSQSRLSAAEEENKRLRDGLAKIADGKVGPETNWHAHWWRLVKIARELLTHKAAA
jgi:hypothetical protein